MMNNNLLLRYEFKYFITNKISEEILKQSLHFMNIDNYAKKNKDHKYLVRSLYYDNNDYGNFYEKVDGIKIRKKFRLRSYDKNIKSKSPIFLEMKGRVHDRIIKKRIQINKNDTKYFETLTNLDELSTKYKGNDLIKEFIFDVRKKNIKPKIMIDYKRQPLINRHGLYFRLTFKNLLLRKKIIFLMIKINLIFL